MSPHIRTLRTIWALTDCHFDKYNVLENAQHGFRKNRSTVSQLVITVNDFASSLRDQKQTDAILLDFSKAFDKVDHEGLLLKLCSKYFLIFLIKKDFV